MFPIEQHTIFLTLAGSQAHGTAREGSDVDIRGVCVAPLPVRVSLFKSFEQYEGPLPAGFTEAVIPCIQKHPSASRGLDVKTECVIFDVSKFLGLCAAANPNALEILFASEQDWLLATPRWRRIHDQRRHFLTKKVQQTFLGYALAQLKKIQTHRSWLLNPPGKKPAREDFGLPPHGGTLSADDQNRIEQSIAEKMRSYGIDNVDMPKATRIAVQERLEGFYRDAAATTADDVEERMRAVATAALGVPSEIAATLNAEKRYRAALKHWDSYQAWKTQRNPARAELERIHGYDTKHAMHLIRLMRMGLEVLETGELRVRRDDAAQLSAIRDGSMSFEELLSTATALQQSMQHEANVSGLPNDVDYDRVDVLLADTLAIT
jgi:predicted nucleotidyltransferase